VGPSQGRARSAGSQAALIASAAGLFGLAQYKDKIVRPDLLTLAVIAAAFAVGASLWATNGLRTLVFRPARLDLMRPGYEHAVSAGTKASNRGLLLLIAAVVVALFSVWPTEEKEETISSTVSWSASKVPESATTAVRLALRWTGLPSDVATVRTIVRRDMTEVARGDAAPTADRTAEADYRRGRQAGQSRRRDELLGQGRTRGEPGRIDNARNSVAETRCLEWNTRGARRDPRDTVDPPDPHNHAVLGGNGGEPEAIRDSNLPANSMFSSSETAPGQHRVSAKSRVTGRFSPGWNERAGPT
jgi:hypothetical protein